MTTIVLPKYNGPAIPVHGTYAECLATIGPAPEGWKYLSLGDRIPNGAIILFKEAWKGATITIGDKLTNSSWPHAVPTKKSEPSPLDQVKEILTKDPSLAKEIIGLALEKLA